MQVRCAIYVVKEIYLQVSKVTKAAGAVFITLHFLYHLQMELRIQSVLSCTTFLVKLKVTL